MPAGVGTGEAYLQRYSAVQTHSLTDALFDGIESKWVGPTLDFTTAVHSHVHRLMSASKGATGNVVAADVGASGVIVPAGDVTVEMEDSVEGVGRHGDAEDRRRSRGAEAGRKGEEDRRVEEGRRSVGEGRRQLAKSADPADAVTLLKVAQPWGKTFQQRNTWKLTSPCSKWFGVTCSPPTTGFNVVALSLPDLGLRGQLSTALGSLKSLTRLNLSSTAFEKRNMFTGSLPSTLQGLSKLQILLLPNTAVAGTIPTGIQNLQKLKVLALSGNLLTGPIPLGVRKAKTTVTLNTVQALSAAVSTVPVISAQSHVDVTSALDAVVECCLRCM